MRYRLLALVLVPLLLLSGTVILLAAKWSSDYTYEQLFAKVNADLQVAGESFRRIREDTRSELSAVAGSASLVHLLRNASFDDIMQLLADQQGVRGFDFLRAWSVDGSRVLTSAGWQPGRLRAGPLAAAVSGATPEKVTQQGVAGIELYEPADWQEIPGIDASRVVLPLVPTARARPTDRQVEDRAMVIRSLHEVRDVKGQLVALLEGGVLLNRNFAFVDEIRDLVYGPGSLAPDSRGTVTLFLDDVRISTNVPWLDDTRALGTRVSSEVYRTVLSRGDIWIDRAFVVKDWYISAYEPVIDVNGERIGMLYAGYLEAPFRARMLMAIAVLSVLVIAGSLLAGLAAILGARSIFAPIETMTAVVRATAAGEHRRIGPLSPGSEIGELASNFDVMLDTLELHRRRIEQDAALLEDKVKLRTAELEKQNRRLQDSIDLLQQTRRQLANAEKLAALGELTAGVAHEINNPTAVILGNMDVLVADLGEGCEQVQTEIDLIFEQVYRIRSITDRLLQYSRSGQLAPEQSSSAPVEPQGGGLTPVSLPKVIEDSLTLLAHELDGRQVVVAERHETTRAALIDRQELQQVLVNLLSNAIQSMAQGGQIRIETRDGDNEVVGITIHDSGCGIEPDDLPRVFDPFFTSGKASGTGLGLSVSYGIVRRFGGDIQVYSERGVGSVFEVVLPGVTDNTLQET
ncbi:sensor histidine kinase [Granulosicoccus sp. 3-233]|uniref:sensor histidine kinase n=1 Tax=Granulosicoccus sp. 3-233 TaxID=3417969 RepID=UPI003D3385A6